MDTISTKVRVKEIIFPVLFVLAGIMIAITARKYEIGSITIPSAGFFPVVIGFCLTLFGILDFRNSIKVSTPKVEVLEKDSVLKIAAVFLVLIFWPALLDLLGYLLVTFMVTLILAKLFRLEGWIKPLILAFGTTLFIHFCFREWFYLDLPDGQIIDLFKSLIGG